MSFIEFGFIDREEYDWSERDRLDEHNINGDELYTVMFALIKDRQNPFNREAIMLPLYTKERSLDEVGKFTVALLNADLESRIVVQAKFSDGYWEPPFDSSVGFYDKAVGSRYVRIRPSSAYLRHFNGSLGDEQIIRGSLGARDSGLVGV